MTKERLGFWKSNDWGPAKIGNIWVADGAGLALHQADYERPVETVVIGGRTIFDLFWDRLDRIYLTKVDDEYPDSDTFFPYPLSPHEWREEPAYDRFFVDPSSNTRLSFSVYHRDNGAAI